jgi:glutathione S-transferase
VSLTLYMHPLASFCHKVLIALYENDTPFTPRVIDFANAEDKAELFNAWPVGKFPLLIDGERQRTVPESTVIVEYLNRFFPGPVTLLPTDPDAQHEVRLWDRFFDNYVQFPMQRIVGDRLRPEAERDARGGDEAKASLRVAYDMLEKQCASGAWATGAEFTMADCAAAPALFYAGIVVPFSEGHRSLRAYFDRLMTRPSVKRTIDEARPYFPNFPFNDDIPARFL